MIMRDKIAARVYLLLVEDGGFAIFTDEMLERAYRAMNRPSESAKVVADRCYAEADCILRDIAEQTLGTVRDQMQQAIDQSAQETGVQGTVAADDIMPREHQRHWIGEKIQEKVPSRFVTGRGRTLRVMEGGPLPQDPPAPLREHMKVPGGELLRDVDKPDIMCGMHRGIMGEAVVLQPGVIATRCTFQSVGVLHKEPIRQGDDIIAGIDIYVCHDHKFLCGELNRILRASPMGKQLALHSVDLGGYRWIPHRHLWNMNTTSPSEAGCKLVYRPEVIISSSGTSTETMKGELVHVAFRYHRTMPWMPFPGRQKLLEMFVADDAVNSQPGYIQCRNHGSICGSRQICARIGKCQGCITCQDCYHEIYRHRRDNQGCYGCVGDDSCKYRGECPECHISKVGEEAHKDGCQFFQRAGLIQVRDELWTMEEYQRHLDITSQRTLGGLKNLQTGLIEPFRGSAVYAGPTYRSRVEMYAADPTSPQSEYTEKGLRELYRMRHLWVGQVCDDYVDSSNDTSIRLKDVCLRCGSPKERHQDQTYAADPTSSQFCVSQSPYCAHARSDSPGSDALDKVSPEPAWLEMFREFTESSLGGETFGDYVRWRFLRALRYRVSQRFNDPAYYTLSPGVRQFHERMFNQMESVALRSGYALDTTHDGNLEDAILEAPERSQGASETPEKQEETPEPSPRPLEAVPAQDRDACVPGCPVVLFGRSYHVTGCPNKR